MSRAATGRLSCRELVGLLTDHLDGDLPASTAARVEAHLATCSDCGAYLDQIRTTIEVVERLRVRDVPEPVLDELVRASRGWSAG